MSRQNDSRMFNDISNKNAYAKRAAGGEKPLRRSERLKNLSAFPTAAVAAKETPGVKPADPLDEFDFLVAKDIRFVVSHSRQVYDHFLDIETNYLAPPNYLQGQRETTAEMREILINWLVGVHRRFKLVPQTLYIAVNLLDRFMSMREVARNELQLVGCAALWIASKLEEIYFPDVNEFVHISDRIFKKHDLLAMESEMANALGFRTVFPTSYAFVKRFLRVAGADTRQGFFACYTVERSLQEYSLLRFKPSLIAACAVKLALEVVPDVGGVSPKWTAVLEAHSRLRERDLIECLGELRRLMEKAAHGSMQSVRRRYLSEQFGAIAETEVWPQ